MTYSDLNNPIFQDADKAREYLEAQRWPTGPVCPHCGSVDENVVKLAGKSTRPGLYACKGCRGHFSVTVGTVYERSHIPLNKWLMAAFLMASSKKGISAHQGHRMLGITYKSAWFMCHRIRHALDQGMETKLDGVLEADETWVGGKPRKVAGQPRQGIKGRGTPKAPVAVLVQRDGAAVCKPIKNASSKELRTVAQHAAPTATLMTDEWKPYGPIGREMAAHHRVNHSQGQYVNKLPDGTMVHSNTAESFFALLKRGVGSRCSVSRRSLRLPGQDTVGQPPP
jgi:transposase-like protein